MNSKATAWRWTRRNLLLNPFDMVLTALLIPSLLLVVLSLSNWAIGAADWRVVEESIKVLMTGVFPQEELWRAKVSGVLLLLLFGIALAVSTPLPARRLALSCGIALSASGFVTAFLGGEDWILPGVAASIAAWVILPRSPQILRLARYLALGCGLTTIAIIVPVPSHMWGGLLLSVLLTLLAGTLTVPIGILLAFGRQSRIGSVRVLSTGFIETIRAVPLILIVYLVWISVPLLLPEWGIPNLLRGLIGFVIFYSAYAAEYLRSGLQAVDRGQSEAAEALGYSPLDIKRLIVLPQALRVALPGLVGNILDIFNFAPLIFIIGLTDLLRAGQMILANPQNSSNTFEVYAFLFVVYYTIGSALTFLARRVEDRFSRKDRA